MIPPRLVKTFALFTILVAVYFIAGKLGLRLAFANRSATAVWPPTGLALAAFLIFGYRVWPAIFVSSFLVNVTTAGLAATVTATRLVATSISTASRRSTTSMGTWWATERSAESWKGCDFHAGP